MSVARTERSDIRALASPAQSFCDVDAGAPVGDVGGVLAVEVVVCFRDRRVNFTKAMVTPRGFWSRVEGASWAFSPTR